MKFVVLLDLLNKINVSQNLTMLLLMLYYISIVKGQSELSLTYRNAFAEELQIETCKDRCNKLLLEMLIWLFIHIYTYGSIIHRYNTKNEMLYILKELFL